LVWRLTKNSLWFAASNQDLSSDQNSKGLYHFPQRVTVAQKEGKYSVTSPTPQEVFLV
jgi:hypothetical protein